MTGKTLVILGSDIPALNVVRDAHRHGMKAVVFDVRRGIACRSSLAQVELHAGTPVGELMDVLYKLGRDGQSYLIATSDFWLGAIIKNRAKLEESYKQILHATSEVLSTCLNKKEFAAWCAERDIDAPRLFLDEEDTVSRLADSGNGSVILRPTMSVHTEPNSPPTALEIRDVQSLKSWTSFFRKRGTDFIVTESVLDRDVVQFSVPFVRTDRGTLSFVAKKVRPQPRECAVGTYVELSPNPEIEHLAQRVANELDYYGMGEIEVLYSPGTGKKWVIELNPRPWIQYALAVESQHDFLKCLLDGNDSDFTSGIKTGKRWMNFGTDLFFCFSRSVGQVRRGDLTFGAYLSSVLKANVFPVLCRRDLAPLWYSITRLFKMTTRSGRRGSKDLSPPSVYDEEGFPRPWETTIT